MPPTLTQLTPNLYVTQSRLFYTNQGVFISEGQACLVDPGIYPDEIDSLIGFLSERGVTVQAIVLTHSHWDHILGPQYFPTARIIAQESYLAETRQHGDNILKSITDWQQASNVQIGEPFAIPQPTETFRQTTTLAIGELTLRLSHAPGHASDQLTVYHAESATLWAADMLSDLEIPFVSHDLDAYERTLATLANWDIRILIPGHGYPNANPTEIQRRLSEDIAYLAKLRSNVKNAIREGRTLEETVALCSSMVYRKPTDNQQPHSWNVETAYVQLGGKTAKTKVGWEQEWEP